MLVKAVVDTNVLLTDILQVSRDPKDDMFLACAVISDSDYLVSGDSDLQES
ncbi:putative toxin-antitoxin system toxin component, PIN family [bacterium]|nr:putative toxin-antitoxin system toxin component, PIN family [bacterium]